MRVETMSERSAAQTAVLVRTAPPIQPRHRLRTRLLCAIGCLAVVLVLSVAIARPSPARAQRTGSTTQLTHPPVLGQFRPK